MKLEQGPFRVTLAYDGSRRSKRSIARRDIKVVWLDLMMPHVSRARRAGANARRTSGRRNCRASSSPRPARTRSVERAMALGATRVHDEAVQPQATAAPHRGAGRRQSTAMPRTSRTAQRPEARGEAGKSGAVILAGGVGSRFWPVSTAERPKQLLPLASERRCCATRSIAWRRSCDPEQHADAHQRVARGADPRAGAGDPAREHHRRAAAGGNRGRADVGGER